MLSNLINCEQVRAAKLARLLKMVRVLKLGRVLHHLEDSASLSPAVLQAIKLLLQVWLLVCVVAVGHSNCVRCCTSL